MKRPSWFLAGLLCFAWISGAQQTAPKTGASKPIVSPGQGSQPKFKAIWEPVNYKEDLNLFAAYFVSPDEGWVSGSAGTILHTKDGGNTWTAELGGDRQAQGQDLKHVFFADPKHGWVQAWNTLYRTTDGESWQQVDGDIRGDVFFVSALKGFRAYGSQIFATNDGGINWKEIFTCHAKMEVQGLTQEKDCDLYTLDFPTATVGYAMGEARVTAKTEDGGDRWSVLVGPDEPGDQHVFSVSFVNANTGYKVRSNKIFKTTDGGQTWQSLIATLSQGYPGVKFASQEVGWSCLGGTWAYTVDGGKRWTTRQVHFPTEVQAFSLPARDRGYVVGNHGMIYRYRVVPVAYTSKGMIDAPMMGEPPAS